ncbi:lysoplasmalogenase [soil metagenome]
MFALLIGLTLVVAAADWWASYTERRPYELVLKPLTMVVLIAATAVMPDPVSDTARWIILIALIWSLAGDVCLLFAERFFLSGLVAFLLAHVAYTIAMLQIDVVPPLLMLGTVAVLIAAAVVGSRIIRGVQETEPAMVGPVVAYLAVISFMVVAAIGTGTPFAIVGALLFYASDGFIGWNRFVEELPYRNLLVMVTYHLGQVGLVLSLTL